ncbi:lysozyme, partial [Enterococcus faecalis]
YLLAMVTLQMKNIRLNQEWSLQRARLLQILRDDLNEHAALISKLLTIKATQNQFDALVSFSHSKGLGFLPSSDIMHFTNNKEFNSAAREMKLYVYDIGSIKLPKLVERRNAETALYLEGASGNEGNNKSRTYWF